MKFGMFAAFLMFFGKAWIPSTLTAIGPEEETPLSPSNTFFPPDTYMADVL
jgi:hypothetical protein